MLHSSFARANRVFTSLFVSVIFLLLGQLHSQEKIVWNDQEKPIVTQINGLRKLDDATRARTTKELALEIRNLPAGPHKLGLAGGLANLATEGDFGRETLQEVTTTLATALREYPPVAKPDGPNHHYMELATLVRYEHMKTDCNDPQFTDALAKLAAADSARQSADFSFKDLEGESLASAGTPRESSAAQFLGDLVSALPERDARLAGALR